MKIVLLPCSLSEPDTNTQQPWQPTNAVEPTRAQRAIAKSKETPGNQVISATKSQTRKDALGP